MIFKNREGKNKKREGKFALTFIPNYDIIKLLDDAQFLTNLDKCCDSLVEVLAFVSR
jgi:hypothetical protein